VQWILSGLVAALLLALLALERRRLSRCHAAVPLRIAVTGTRGKSTVVRLLAAVLRAAGRTVLAKTTGSEPVLVLPDGTEQPIRRRGAPSIIEQKHVLHRAAALGADTAVMEVMSVRPENHRVEGRQLIRPHVVVATNFRVDHTGVQGTTRGDIAGVLALALPPGATCFVPTAECEPAFRRAAAAAGASVVEVAAEGGIRRAGVPAADTVLVRAVARWLGIGEAAIDAGIAAARLDVGAARAWRVTAGPAAGCFLVSAFAANDPVSTAIVHDAVVESLGLAAAPCIGLLNLRADRADRTLQWIDALGGPMGPRFRRIVVCGDHVHAAARRLRRVRPGLTVDIVSGTDPVRITDVALGDARQGDVVLGFGNIAGAGRALVQHWAAAFSAVEA
jgi:gamma-polyglutamate synthase